MSEHLAAYLAGKHTLLLVDNFEQVLAAGPELSALLAAVPGLKLLVTSRIVLHLQAEQEYPVPPLGLPEQRSGPSTVAQLSQYNAVRLFIERAQAARPAFAVTNENAPAVAEICARLDGLPLAIELAAARVRLFTPEALLARLGDRLGLLTGGARDLPARQQTLRNTIGWSYQLLDVAEQTLFARLGVFVGGWTLAAAEAVAGDDVLPAQAVLGLLEALVDKSLVKIVDAPGGELRFAMLETLREYALERLAERGETETLRRRHAEHFVAFAELAEPELRGPHTGLWMERLEADYDNLWATLQWSRDTAAGELGLRLAGALWLFWELHGHRREARDWLATLLAAPETQVRTAVRAKGLLVASHLATNAGDAEPARASVTEGLAIAQLLGDDALHARALWETAGLSFLPGNPGGAQPLLEEVLTRFRHLGDQSSAAQVLLDLALLQTDPAKAERLSAELLSLARAIEFPHLMAMALWLLGERAMELNEIGSAVAHFQEGLQLARASGDRRTEANLLASLGRANIAQNHLTQATSLLSMSIELFRKQGVIETIARPLQDLGSIAYWRGDLDGADEQFATSCAVVSPGTYRHAVALALRAKVAEARGEYEQADALLMESLAEYRGVESFSGQALTLCGLGRCARKRGERARAIALLKEGLHLYDEAWKRFREPQIAYGIAGTLIDLAELSEELGAIGRAERLWGAAAALGAGSRPDMIPCRADEGRRIAAAMCIKLSQIARAKRLTTPENRP